MSRYCGELPGFVWDPVRQAYYRTQSGPGYNSIVPPSRYTVAEAVEGQDHAVRGSGLARSGLHSLAPQSRPKQRLLWEVSRMTRNLDLTDRTTRSQGDNFHQSILRLGGAAKLNALFKKDSVFVNGLIDGFHDATGTDLPPSPYQNQGKCVESFDYDQETATLVVGHSLGIPSSQDQFIYYPTITPGSAKGAPVQWMSACNLAVSNGSSTVVAEILPVQSKVQILVTRGGLLSAPLVSIQPQQDNNNHPAINLSPQLFSIVRSHAVNPFDTTNGTCAIGTDYGILMTDAMTGSFKTRFRTYSGHDDFRAVDFLDHNILIGGKNDRTIILWDTRSPNWTSRAFAPSSIRSVRRADCAERFLVRGSFGHLAMHDLRFIPAAQPSSSNPPSSSPYLEFPRLPQSATQHVGFDVSLELGLLAAGTLPNRVGLYSLRTAQKVGEVDVGVVRDGRPPSTDVTNVPHTIKFRADRDGAAMILAATLDGVVKVGL